MASRPQPSDAELRAWLDDLAAHLDVGASVDLAADVRRRLEAQVEVPAEAPRAIRPGRLAVAGLAAAVLVSALLTFSPTTRRAVADLLGLRGVRIEQRDVPTPPAGARLHLGARVSRRGANDRMGFDVVALPAKRFGPPDEIYVAKTSSGPRATLLYKPQAGLPAAVRGVGLLLTQFRADVDDSFVRKVVSSGGRIDDVTVDGERGYWLGAPHVMWFTDGNGRPFEDRSRLAGSTLIWERGPLTLRLESALSRDEAIRLAAAL